jgi:hypothetical protein
MRKNYIERKDNEIKDEILASCSIESDPVTCKKSIDQYFTKCIDDHNADICYVFHSAADKGPIEYRGRTYNREQLRDLICAYQKPPCLSTIIRDK